MCSISYEAYIQMLHLTADRLECAHTKTQTNTLSLSYTMNSTISSIKLRVARNENNEK